MCFPEFDIPQVHTKWNGLPSFFFLFENKVFWTAHYFFLKAILQTNPATKGTILIEQQVFSRSNSMKMWIIYTFAFRIWVISLQYREAEASRLFQLFNKVFASIFRGIIVNALNYIESVDNMKQLDSVMSSYMSTKAHRMFFCNIECALKRFGIMSRCNSSCL